MLHYIVTAAHRYTIDRYLAVWGHRIARQIRVIPYERFRHQRYFAGGAYIFTDIDRIDDRTRLYAGLVAGALIDAGNVVLNHPERVLLRFELQHRLHESGRNNFRACRQADWQRLRFPAFLRRANEHSGSLTPLLHDLAELHAAAAALPNDVPREDVIAVEFIDTAGAGGVYRKYSVHRVGDSFIPRHVMCSNDWVGKYADLVGPQQVREELDFLRDSPYAAEVKEAFDFAAIDYGRIDFGVAGGRVQVWEINTNPSIAPELDRLHPSRFEAVQKSVNALTESFERIASAAGVNCKIRLTTEQRKSLGSHLSDAGKTLSATAWRRLRDIRGIARLTRSVEAWHDRFV